MASTESEIRTDISDYIREEGSPYRYWYVGITSDATRRLFTEHGVSKDSGRWIYRTAYSSDTARRVEQYFLGLGCDGGPGGGDDTCCVVYAYRKTALTSP